MSNQDHGYFLRSRQPTETTESEAAVDMASNNNLSLSPDPFSGVPSQDACGLVCEVPGLAGSQRVNGEAEQGGQWTPSSAAASNKHVVRRTGLGHQRGWTQLSVTNSSKASLAIAGSWNNGCGRG